MALSTTFTQRARETTIFGNRKILLNKGHFAIQGHSTINELIGEKSTIKIMDDVTDDCPLTGNRETTFELINYYLQDISGD